ncbi:MAG: S8/S53 family peptidase, partial [Gemmatimonadaceae bacterium]
MPDNSQVPAKTNGILVKLRPSNALRAAESRANLRPLHETSPTAAPAFGIGSEPKWYLADLPDGAGSPWDLAHGRVADQLGVAHSDVIFAEPDIVHQTFLDTNEVNPGQAFALGKNCETHPQDGKNGKAVGPNEFAWHLGDDYTQLRKARAAVEFTDPRTRIGHLDTGYYRKHSTTPEHIIRRLERSFVKGDADPTSAEDPDNRAGMMDNSGHGTGTISILAGGKVDGEYLGGAPDADILPIRVADSVVLLSTSAFAQALHYAVVHGCDVVTMSMGGLPSDAWRETIDEAYLAGLCVVAAAGNNSNGLPTRHLVYPARYRRVLAVCGVMANDKPYSGLTGGTTLEGNYGPGSRMNAAIATYTP